MCSRNSTRKRYDFRGNDPEDFREPTRVSYHLAFFCQHLDVSLRHAILKFRVDLYSFDSADV